jgi:hypothetical protein
VGRFTYLCTQGLSNQPVKADGDLTHLNHRIDVEAAYNYLLEMVRRAFDCIVNMGADVSGCGGCCIPEVGHGGLSRSHPGRSRPPRLVSLAKNP